MPEAEKLKKNSKFSRAIFHIFTNHLTLLHAVQFEAWSKCGKAKARLRMRTAKVDKESRVSDAQWFLKSKWVDTAWLRDNDRLCSARPNNLPCTQIGQIVETFPYLRRPTWLRQLRSLTSLLAWAQLTRGIARRSGCYGCLRHLFLLYHCPYRFFCLDTQNTTQHQYHYYWSTYSVPW
jgi:hypothetical protein